MHNITNIYITGTILQICRKNVDQQPRAGASYKIDLLL